MYNSCGDCENYHQCCIHNIYDNTWELSTLLNILLLLLSSIERYLLKQAGFSLNNMSLKMSCHAAEIVKGSEAQVSKKEANVADMGVYFWRMYARRAINCLLPTNSNVS